MAEAMIDFVSRWMLANAADLDARGLHLSSLQYGPEERAKRSVWFDIDAPTRMVRVCVWDSGEATVTVLNVADGESLAATDPRFSSESELEAVLLTAVNWAEDRTSTNAVHGISPGPNQTAGGAG